MQIHRPHLSTQHANQTPSPLTNTPQQAAKLYRQIQRCARLMQWQSFLWGERPRLHSFESARQQFQLRHSRYIGLQRVPLRAVCGSEGPQHDFDAHFLPSVNSPEFRARWLAIAQARLDGIELPPVNLLVFAQRYYVRDGHYRISVACALGQPFIDAEVIAWEA